MRSASAAALLLAFFSACAESGPTGPTVVVNLTEATITVTSSLTHQFTATVTGSTNVVVTWSLQEGAAAGGVSGTGLYTATATPGTYHVIATSVADVTRSDTATVTVVAPPVITAFVAAASTITVGNSTVLTGTFTGGAGVVDQGIGAVSSGIAISTGALNATRAYKLRVTNAAGTIDSATVTVTVVPAPTIASFVASSQAIATGQSVTLTGVFANGVGYVAPGNLAITSGVGLATAVLTASTTYKLIVKNAAGDSVVSGDVPVTVYTSAPTINAFTATPAIITQGDSTLLAWTLTGAVSLSLNQSIGTVTGTSRWHTPPGAVTYTLSATNPVGTVTANASVTVVFPPVISNFTVTPTALVAGASAKLRGVFTQGTGTVDQGVGAITSGDSVAVSAINASTTFTLSVTNAAGRTVTRTATVVTDPGSFAATGSMSNGRHFHATVLLADGHVLALGGYDSNGRLSTAETYDPGTGVWMPTAGPLTQERNYPEAILLADGRVLVTGGITGGSYTAAAELYDPISRTFVATGPMDTARVTHAMHLLDDGRVLVLGGTTLGLNPTSLTQAEIYNPTTGTFSNTGSLGLARWYWPGTARLPDGRVLVMSGIGSSSDGTSIEIYDPALGLFGPAAGTTAGNASVVRLLDGSVLAAGSNVTKRWSNGTLTTVGAQVRPRFQVSRALLLPTGKVLIVGDSGAPGQEGRSEAELFDPTTNAHRLTGKTMSSRGSPRANLLRTGAALMVGGFAWTPGGPGSPQAATELYDPGAGLLAAAPTSAVTAPGAVTTGATGIAISIPATPGARYVWYVVGGTVTAGSGTNAITVTAGAAGTMQVRVLVISELQIPAAGSANVTVNP